MKLSLFVLAPILLCVLLPATGAGVTRAEQANLPLGQFITVNGVKLHYVIAGEGPGIVLVHGASLDDAQLLQQELQIEVLVDEQELAKGMARQVLDWALPKGASSGH